MKKLNGTIIACGAAIAMLLLPGCSRYVDEKRIDPATHSISAVDQGFDTVGRKWSQTTVTKTPAPVKTEAPKSVRETSGAIIRTGLIELNKRVPATATLGQEYTQEMTATALDDCANIVITDTVPGGASYVRSTPDATKEGDLLSWKFPTMKKGEVKRILVTFRADREGELVSCVTITAVPYACVSILVGKPVLTIEKSGTESTLLGSNVFYRIVVANRGSAVAKDVVVTDDIPAGLSHASGQRALTFNVGDLAPNQTKELSVMLKADQTGRFCNNASAVASNHTKVSDDACTTVVKPGIKITKVGDKEQFIGRTAKYTIEVENIGDTTLTNVRLVDTAPNPTTIVAADGAALANNTATWTIGSMAPKEKKSFTVTLTSKAAGNYCNGATVVADGGLRDSATACTLWKGVAAILVEMVDDPDPVQVGTTTTYTIRITNQGNADLHNVSSVLDFEDAVQPTASAQGKIAGQKVTFPTQPVLGPKASVTFTVTVKAVKAAETINKLRVKCDEGSREIEENESTTTY